MQMPEEMRRFVRSFHQDIYDKSESLEQIIDNRVAVHSMSERKAVIAYLKALLETTRDPDALMKVWLGAEPDWGCNREGYPYFFDLLVDRLSRSVS